MKYFILMHSKLIRKMHLRVVSEQRAESENWESSLKHHSHALTLGNFTLSKMLVLSFRSTRNNHNIRLKVKSAISLFALKQLMRQHLKVNDFQYFESRLISK